MGRNQGLVFIIIIIFIGTVVAPT
jgi:hypothetical protein